MKKFLLLMLFIVAISTGYSKTVNVTNNGLTFSPNVITINLGDTIGFTLASSHNVVEVSQDTWNANGNTPLNGGFSLPFGGGQLILTNPGTYYFVCSPHASLGMKGTITVSGAATVISSNEISSNDFVVYPDPATDYVNIKMNLPESSHVTMELFDITGKMVSLMLSKDLSAGEFQQQFSLDRSRIKTGRYFIRSHYDKKSFTQSIIVR